MHALTPRAWFGVMALVVAGAACSSTHDARGAAADGDPQAPATGGQQAQGSGAGEVALADAAVAASGAGAGTAHEIVSGACDVQQPFGADVPVVSGLSCIAPSPQSAGGCRPGIECMGPSDCELRPFARCQGFTFLHCVYPGIDAGTPSWMTSCVADRECMQAPGGRCARLVTHSRCNYEAQCERDADCGATERCACGISGALGCVPAQCLQDADCDAGQRCRRDYVCGYPFGGFFCTRAQDECRGDDECAPGRCDRDDDEAGAWRCSNEAPCTIP